MATFEERLREELAGASKVVVLGLGSELRGDDAAGLLAAQSIESAVPPRYRVYVAGNVPENYLGAIREEAPSLVVVIDAADMGMEPGHVALVPRTGMDRVTSSTHSLPLGMLIDYLSGDIGSRVVVVGIQPKRVGLGDAVSEEVQAAVRRLVRLFAEAGSG